jgi:hypothetical protein
VIKSRRRIELLHGALPRQPYHAAAEGGLSIPDAKRLIAEVEAMAMAEAADATVSAAEEFAASAVGIVGGGRQIPSQLERILASHALLHAAEGDLYEQAIAEAAGRHGMPVLFLPAGTIAVSGAIEMAGKALGPPWQKDHKLAASVALMALSEP